MTPRPRTVTSTRPAQSPATVAHRYDATRPGTTTPRCGVTRAAPSSRVALLPEGGHPLAALGGAEVTDRAGAELGGVVPDRGRRSAAQQLLGAGQRGRARRGPARRSTRATVASSSSAGDRRGDQADLGGPARRRRARRSGTARRRARGCQPAAARSPRSPPGSRPRRTSENANVAVGRADGDVGGGDQAEPAGPGRAADPGDHRLRALATRGEHVAEHADRHLPGRVRRGGLLQVGARSRTPARCATSTTTRTAASAAAAASASSSSRHQRRGQRVAVVRAVEGERGHPARRWRPGRADHGRAH